MFFQVRESQASFHLEFNYSESNFARKENISPSGFFLTLALTEITNIDVITHRNDLY